MALTALTDSDTERAREIWSAYVREHDISNRIDQAAGIDPVTGRVWFGKSAADIVSQMDATGGSTPLYFIRVGQATYLRKGGRR